MWHLQDLLTIAIALAVILVVLVYGNLVNTRSPLSRTLTRPVRVLSRSDNKEKSGR